MPDMGAKITLFSKVIEPTFRRGWPLVSDIVGVGAIAYILAQSKHCIEFSHFDASCKCCTAKRQLMDKNSG
jgi:hypothetical protein